MDDEEIGKAENLNDYILDIAREDIDGSFITKSAIVYEYINSDGELKYGMIHERSVSRYESAQIIVKLFSIIAKNSRDYWDEQGNYDDGD